MLKDSSRVHSGFVLIIKIDYSYVVTCLLAHYLIFWDFTNVGRSRGCT